MNKLTVTLLMVFFATGVFAQNKVSFKGTVHPEVSDKEVVVKEGGRTIAAFPVNADKTFSGEVPLDRIKQLGVAHGECQMSFFAQPGRVINIDFGKGPKTGKFTGSPETEYYLDMRFLFSPSDPAMVWKMSWDVYRKYVENALESRMKYSEVFCKLYNIDPDFQKEVENFNKYAMWGTMIVWPQFYKKANQLTEFKEEKEWKAYVNTLYSKIEWDNPKLCGLPQFVNFAENALNEEIKKDASNASFVLNAFDHIDKKIGNSAVKEFFKVHYTQKYLKDEPASNLPKIVERYKSEIKNQTFLARLDEMIKDVQRFGSNAPAFDFALEDINGKKVSLSDFKGKVVYLDFWATWCGPCLAEVPHMNELKKQLKDNKDIVVICISVDEARDKEKWKQKVKEMGMDGYQLFAAENAAEVKKYYNVRGIPHFTMIDRDGKIYKNQTIRPSNPQTKSVLLNLANEGTSRK